EVLYDKSEPQEIEVAHEFPNLGRKVMRINVSRVHRKENSTDMLLLAIEDITAVKEMEENIKTLRETIVHLYQKNRYESIVSKVAQSLHQSINLQEVLDNAVSIISENIDSVDYIAIYMVEGKEAVMKSHKGLPDWAIEGLGKITYPRGFIWKAIVEGTQVYCADIENDRVIEPTDKKMDIKSYMYMPLKSEGNTIGVISIKSLRVNPMGDEEINLVETLKKELETSIKNTQESETLRKSDQHYAKTNGELATRVKSLTEELRKANERIISETRERKRLEEELKSSATELKDSKHELENFIYVVSHELKEPLKKIQASCSHLEEKNGKALKSDGCKYLRQIDNAVKKMQSPIHDLETRYQTATKDQHNNGNGRNSSLTSPSLKVKKCS
ncbi:MAG: GAF domain-containing protein, partial [Thermodesulfobacteriota bacterium]